jgi:hypothetical protein
MMQGMSTLTLTAFIKTADDGHFVVESKCNERPELSTRFGMSCGKSRLLAERLVRAINAGAAWTNPQVVRDVHDVEYVTFDGSQVMGRYLNADLKRLGF